MTTPIYRYPYLKQRITRTLRDFGYQKSELLDMNIDKWRPRTTGFDYMETDEHIESHFLIWRWGEEDLVKGIDAHEEAKIRTWEMYNKLKDTEIGKWLKWDENGGWARIKMYGRRQGLKWD